jgi:hypothetical protein
MTVEMRVAKPVQTCEEFQDQLPEMFESGEEFHGVDHLQSCENCAALVRDLEYIAQQAKLLLPLRDPSPAVWNNIQQKLNEEPKS